MARFALGLILAACFCAGVLADDDSLDTKIFGGTAANEAAYPYQVSLQIQANKRLIYKFCGGVILNPNWILTAAHCFDDDKGEAMYIRAGIVKVFEKYGNAQYIEMDKKFLHTGYKSTDPDVNDDIALIKLKSSLVFNKYVQPIGLPPASYDPTGSGTILGWGLTSANGVSSDVLLYAPISVYPPEKCKKFYTLTDKQMCLGDAKSTTSTCGGDSGGPFIQEVGGKLMTVGIVSFGECGSTPVVFTKVSKYLDFITKTMANN